MMTREEVIYYLSKGSEPHFWLTGARCQLAYISIMSDIPHISDPEEAEYQRGWAGVADWLLFWHYEPFYQALDVAREVVPPELWVQVPPKWRAMSRRFLWGHSKVISHLREERMIPPDSLTDCWIDPAKTADAVARVLAEFCYRTSPDGSASCEAVKALPPPPPSDTATSKVVRKKDIRARMTTKLAQSPEALDWSCQQWADYLGCAKSTVGESKIWKEIIMTHREAAKRFRYQRYVPPTHSSAEE